MQKSKLTIIVQSLILWVLSYLLYVFPVQMLLRWAFDVAIRPIVLMGSSLSLASCLVIYFKTKITFKFFKWLVHLGAGLFFFAYCLTIVMMIVGLIVNIENSWKASLVVMGTIILMIISKVNGTKIKQKQLEIQHEKIKKATRFVFISDVHIGTQSASYLQRVVTEIEQIKPDFVCIGGDLIDSSSVTIADLKAFKQLKMPVYFITGNHEYYLQNSKQILEELELVNLIWVNNQHIDLGDLTIIGVSDNQSKTEKVKIIQHYADSSKFNIALVHKPSCFDAMNQKPELMLCGHTHNGQTIPFNWIVKLTFPKSYGLYKKGDARLYVSSGVGTWGTKMRLGTQNEIIIITLTGNI